jgi:hypothetical protein
MTVAPDGVRQELSRLIDVFGDPNDIEPLHPDLEAALGEVGNLGTCIRHPLLYSMMHHPSMNRLVNLQYEKKKEMLRGYIRERNWSGVILCHERPYRLDAFEEYVGWRVGPVTWWSVLGHIWQDCENVHENYERWFDNLREGPPQYRWAFTERKEDRAMLRTWQRRRGRHTSTLVYRGVGSADYAEGLSWTLDRRKAVWFAERYAGVEGRDSPTVLTGIVRYLDVVGYFTGRGESEFVVLPENVEIVGRTRL